MKGKDIMLPPKLNVAHNPTIHEQMISKTFSIHVTFQYAHMACFSFQQELKPTVDVMLLWPMLLVKSASCLKHFLTQLILENNFKGENCKNKKS